MFSFKIFLWLMFLNSETEKGVWTTDNSIFNHFKYFIFSDYFSEANMVLAFPSSLMWWKISWNHRSPEIEKNPVISLDTGHWNVRIMSLRWSEALWKYAVIWNFLPWNPRAWPLSSHPSLWLNPPGLPVAVGPTWPSTFKKPRSSSWKGFANSHGLLGAPL